MGNTVYPGIDVLRKNGYAALRGKRVGLMTNASGVDSKLISTYEILWRTPEVNLVALFAPEHGFTTARQDGEEIAHSTDAHTSLPVFSLYGANERPTEAMLSMVDMIVCDIQDIGTRYYTFAWTIMYILESAGAYGVEVLILDRPNPLGGIQVSGQVLTDGIQSLVGRYPIPIQHGMTLGELAQIGNTAWNPQPAPLTIIPCAGWQRSMHWRDTRLEWVPPSPNMPHISTVQHYPGACLIEGTNLSEGRGTALPLEIAGAPWINAYDLAKALNQQEWDGVRFRPHTFVPTASKYQGETCYGVQVHITDRSAFRPIETWLNIIQVIRQIYPEDFEWLPPIKKGDYAHFDRLIGSFAVRPQLHQGVPVAEITQSWAAACQTFAEIRRPYLLY